MYTHMFGYKFCIDVLANVATVHGKSVVVDIMSMPGEFDEDLKWPTSANFTVELVNVKGGKNAKSVIERVTWQKPETDVTCTFIANCFRTREGYYYAFIVHSGLRQFLVNDALHFIVSVKLL